MRTVDLFSGCGGLSCGFENAGYEIIAAFDSWSAAVECYKVNFNHPAFEFDLSNVNDAIKNINLFQPDIIIGGPPCQDFSNAGNREEGERANLTFSFAKIVSSISPKYFVMENVERALESDAYNKARECLKTHGYGLTEVVLDASYCGVPQKRKRFFCIGCLGAADGFMDSLILSDLTILPLTLREYFNKEGYDLSFEYYYRHPRSYLRRGVFSVDEPAPTVRGVNRPKPPTYKRHSGDKADPIKVRALSITERARIQTFPDDFKWKGSTTQVEQMLGNAVPVKLAEYIAHCLSEYEKGKIGMHDVGFIDWLVIQKKYTQRAARDTLSRVKRATRILDNYNEKGTDKLDYLKILEQTNEYKKISKSVQSQIKRALNLYHEYLIL